MDKEKNSWTFEVINNDYCRMVERVLDLSVIPNGTEISLIRINILEGGISQKFESLKIDGVEVSTIAYVNSYNFYVKDPVNDVPYRFICNDSKVSIWVKPNIKAEYTFFK